MKSRPASTIRAATEGDIVTNAKAGESLHNYGLAIDFALRLKDGSVIWDMEYDGNGNGKADWMEVVEIAKDLGFQWGGDWANFPDYPHLQIDFGLTIRDLKRENSSHGRFRVFGNKVKSYCYLKNSMVRYLQISARSHI